MNEVHTTMTISNELSLTPSAGEWLSEMNDMQWMMLIVACVVALVVWIIFGIQLLHIFSGMNYFQSSKLAWLASALPVVALFSVASMISLRSAAVIHLATLMYCAMLVIRALDLISRMFGGGNGGSTSVVLRLQHEHTNVQTNECPLCCCCPCLPSLEPTTALFRRLRFCAQQVAFIRPTTALITIILGYEEMSTSIVRYVLVSINVCSTLLSMYSLNIIRLLLKNSMNERGSAILMIGVQSMLFMVNVERSIFVFLTYIGTIDGTAQLSPMSFAEFVYNFLLIVQLMLLSIVMSLRMRHMTACGGGAVERLQPIDYDSSYS